MKRCPECRRDYTDETLNYCLDDGAALVEGPVSGDYQTAVLPSELETRHIVSRTGESNAAGMSSAEYIITSLGRHKKAVTLASIALVALVAGVGLVLYRSQSSGSNSPKSIRLDKVTTEGKSFAAGISPDGKWAVYNVDEGGAQSLWTRQMATATPVQAIPPAEGIEYSCIRFTPDGNFVTFIKRDTSTTLFSLYQMSVVGGTQKKIADDVDGGVTFSPDGKLMTFVRGNFPEMGDSSVMIANADGRNERVLAKRKRPETFPWWPYGTAAWSPDGKTIATVIGGDASGSGPMELAEVNVDNGSVKQITNGGWYEIGQIIWLPDKSGLLVMGALRASDYHTQQIYLVPYPSGETRRVTADFNNYIGMSLTADGRSLMAIQQSRVSNIWSVPNADASRAVQIKSGGANQEGTDGIAAAPDGRIVFYSKASGADDIWIVNADGSGLKQLTSDAGANYDLKVTRDGRYIVFTSERAGQPNIWRMDLDGGNPKQITFGRSEYNVSSTVDSKWVIYDSHASGTPALWKVSIDGGQPIQLTNRFTENSEISFDGKFMVAQFRENSSASWRFAIFGIDGGEPLRVFDLRPEDWDVRWAPDGKSITYQRTIKGVTNVWSFPLDGSPAKQLTDFKNDRIFTFNWTPDGKSLVMARGTLMADVVLISDFR